MTDGDIVKDSRFRFAVHKGEYSRAIVIFLHIKFPGVSQIEIIPEAEKIIAEKCVDKCFFEKWELEKELAKEMR